MFIIIFCLCISEANTSVLGLRVVMGFQSGCFFQHEVMTDEMARELTVISRSCFVNFWPVQHF